MSTATAKRHKYRIGKMTFLDYALLVVLIILSLMILIPFINVIAISFASQKEYADNPMMLFPKHPTLDAYKALLNDGRILTGFWNTIKILVVGLPLSLFLTSTMAYGLSRDKFPGKKLIFFLVLFTMIFNGGIVPLYLVMKSLHLTGTLWSVILVAASAPST
ncbi:maltose transporter permease [Paenibacillus sp. P1XP2]|nr:maltose transporter permease [Paenibacillus sp. P1XP2]